jgi:hypothetical protein
MDQEKMYQHMVAVMLLSKNHDDRVRNAVKALWKALIDEGIPGAPREPRPAFERDVAERLVIKADGAPYVFEAAQVAVARQPRKSARTGDPATKNRSATEYRAPKEGSL